MIIRHNRTARLYLIAFALMIVSSCNRDSQKSTVPAAVKRVVVYSTIDNLRPLLDEYSAETKIPVLHIKDSETALFEKLRRKGLAEPADLYVGRDVGTLWYAADEDLLRPVQSQSLAIAAEFMRDSDNAWHALSIRARAIAFNPGSVDAARLSGYAELGDEHWAGRLCLSSSALPDNRSLIAELIAQLGQRDAELTVRRWVRNLAQPVYESDEHLANAIAMGDCDVGVVDLATVQHLAVRDGGVSIAAHLPDAVAGGTHIEISGAGVSRHASNPAGAQQLLEWLVQERPQAMIAAALGEFPVANESVPPPFLSEFTGFDASQVPLAQYGYLAQDAVDLAARARYR